MAQMNVPPSNILESISDGFFSLDEELRVTYFNKAAEKLLGRKAETLLGHPLFDNFPEAQGSIFEEKYREALALGKQLSFETYFDTEPYANWYDVRVYPFPGGISVFFQVTTTRHEAEAALRQRNKWLVQLNGISATINQFGETRPLLDATLVALMELLAVDGAQCLLMGENGQDRIWASHGLEPTFQQRVKAEINIPNACLMQAAFEKEAPVAAMGDGTCVWQQLAHAAGYYTIVAVPLLGRADPLGLCVLYNRAERVFTGDELRLLATAGGQLATAVERARLLEAEQNQRRHIEAVQRAGAIVNSSLDLATVLDSILTELAQVIAYDSAAIILREEAGLLIAAARGIPSFAGSRLAAEENELSATIARTRQPLILADARADPRFSRWLETGYVRGWMGIPLLVQGKYIGHLTADSRQKSAYTEADAARALSFAQQAAIAVTNARLHQNVQAQLSALQDAQERLVQSEKLAAIGQLVSGVAHELNNPLGAIQLLGQLVLDKIADSAETVRPDLQQILIQVRRASNIVETLLDFARQRPPVRQPVGVNAIVTSTMELMSYELHTHNVSVELALAPGLPTILADPQQLQQVMVNLLNNAHQAMSQAGLGGRVRVSTVRGEGASAREEVVIMVSDSGPGIPEDELGRIFEPFYTTREPGQGTGLGLSVCHGIISEHGGRIWASSEPGEGATFYIALPVEEESGGRVRTETDEAHRPIDGARILVADDEESLRLAIEDVLTLAGCEVRTVADGRAALAEVAAGYPEHAFDLILCDVRMPGLAGPAFYRQLLASYPGYRDRVLFITGDRLNPATRDFLKGEAVPWLGKPFEVDELLRRVGAMLESADLQQADDGKS